MTQLRYQPNRIWSEPTVQSIIFFGREFFSSCRGALRSYKDGDGGDDCEGGEGDEAEPVDDHGRKLPVADYLLLLVVKLHPIRDELQF